MCWLPVGGHLTLFAQVILFAFTIKLMYFCNYYQSILNDVSGDVSSPTEAKLYTITETENNMKQKVATIEPFVVDTDHSMDTRVQQNMPHSSMEEEASDIKIGDYELYQLLRPVFLSMKGFGLCALDKNSLSSNSSSRFYICYSVFSSLLLYSFVYLQMTDIRGFSTIDDSVFTLSYLVWVFSVIVQGMVIFWMCTIKNTWQLVFDFYECTKQGIWKFDKNTAVKRRIYVYVLVPWIFVIFDTFYNVYGSVIFGKPLAIVCVSCLCSVYFSAAWITPSVLLMSLTDIIGSHFKHFNGKIIEMSKTSPTHLYETIRSVRRLHLILDRVVEASDSVLGKIVVAAVFSKIVLMCCNVYSLVYGIHFFSNDVAVFWFIIEFLVLFGMMGMCARLKEEVSAYHQ